MVQPWLERAGTTFTTVADTHNALAESAGFSAVPTLLLFDKTGRLQLGPINFDIRREGMVEAILAWVNGEEVGGDLAKSRMANETSSEAAHLFQQGQAKLAEGDQAGALDLWQQALTLAPKNWLIRKQIWAVENPDRFYAGPVDFDWQRQQLQREEAL